MLQLLRALTIFIALTFSHSTAHAGSNPDNLPEGLNAPCEEKAADQKKFEHAFQSEDAAHGCKEDTKKRVTNCLSAAKQAELDTNVNTTDADGNIIVGHVKDGLKKGAEEQASFYQQGAEVLVGRAQFCTNEYNTLLEKECTEINGLKQAMYNNNQIPPTKDTKQVAQALEEQYKKTQALRASALQLLKNVALCLNNQGKLYQAAALKTQAVIDRANGTDVANALGSNAQEVKSFFDQATDGAQEVRNNSAYKVAESAVSEKAQELAAAKGFKVGTEVAKSLAPEAVAATSTAWQSTKDFVKHEVLGISRRVAVESAPKVAGAASRVSMWGSTGLWGLAATVALEPSTPALCTTYVQSVDPREAYKNNCQLYTRPSSPAANEAAIGDLSQK